MQIAGVYSFKGGEQAVAKEYPDLLTEVNAVIRSIDAAQYKTKSSKEQTMLGRMLYNPSALNWAFKEAFNEYDGWRSVRVSCDYPTTHYLATYKRRRVSRNAFREMDFVKNRLGIEVQFGKYAFMVYNVCAKMTIFHNLGYIDHGIEIVPVKAFADQMSTGVSYFEQFIWDLESRGVADIDIPVMILGIDAD
jgi:hypothetical protein